MKIALMADTHCLHAYINTERLKDCSFLIHCGDASNTQNKHLNTIELNDFLYWYNSLPNPYKIFVAGNHDTSLESQTLINWSLYPTITYLNHSSISIENINIFGSPYTPAFGQGWAFNKNRSTIASEWETIPSNTDILITHGPPKYHLDTTLDFDNSIQHPGCSALLKTITKIKPTIHAFGHIHGNKYLENNGTLIRNNTAFINCSAVIDGKPYLEYQPTIINYPQIKSLTQ